MKFTGALFDPDRLIGTVVEVGATSAKATLPILNEKQGKWLYGHRLKIGEVGSFVIIETGHVALFGRVTLVRLPEKEKLTAHNINQDDLEFHPSAEIQLLTSISIKDWVVSGGISIYPTLGSKVYSAHPDLVKWLAEKESKIESQKSLKLNLAFLPNEPDTNIKISPERIFGRHVAVLGSTGGGKSWTLARLMGELSNMSCKVILLDATGEFHTLSSGVRHVHIGDAKGEETTSQEVIVPYRQMTQSDLLALFRPRGQAQAPKMRQAMISLKLAELDTKILENGYLRKADKDKKIFYDAYKKYRKEINSSDANFDIKKLAFQIELECVYPTPRGTQPNSNLWGGVNEQDRSYVVTLQSRIDELIEAEEFACLFGIERGTSIFDVATDFLKKSEEKILRVSLKYLPFAYNAREIVANAIGRKFLDWARNGKFKKNPLLVVLDEAHQFLNKNVGEDDGFKYPLDSFELIAKEGRKYSLNICMATQRPRDIPDGVLSQMGTLIVHRLTNEQDRSVVERAAGEIDKSAADFLPSLAPGQVVLIGVDFPFPITIQIFRPQNEPDSRGPDYQSFWKLK